MSAEEIFENCSKTVPKNGRISTGVLPEDQPPPTSPERPGVNLSKEQLLPPTPGGYLENKIWTGLGSSKALAAAPAIVNKKTSGKDTMENGTIHARIVKGGVTPTRMSFLKLKMKYNLTKWGQTVQITNLFTKSLLIKS